MIKAIVTDIEGTTSSIGFVHEVLFPYAREHIAEFVRSHAEDPQVVPYLDDVRRETGEGSDIEIVIDTLTGWIDKDRKITALKALQGIIWERGYRNGDFHGHIYADAFEKLNQWHAQGIALYVYSSGSVYAQELLFGHSGYGDLTPLFSGHFDTNIGAKGEAGSYSRIIQQLGLPAQEILFLSDVKAELDAAATTGMQTCWLVRDKAVDTEAEHRQVSDFNAIDLD